MPTFKTFDNQLKAAPGEPMHESDAWHKLFAKLVPNNGNCKTLEGEMLRALAKIRYRKDLSMTFDEAIAIAKRDVKDLNARVYLNAIPRAIEDYGFDGLHTQILYALSNMGTWRGETAREVKKVLNKWLRDNAPPKMVT